MTTAPSPMVAWTMFAENLVGIVCPPRVRPLVVNELTYTNKNAGSATTDSNEFCEIRIRFTYIIDTCTISLIRASNTVRVLIAVNQKPQMDTTYNRPFADAILDVVHQKISVEDALARKGLFADFVKMLQKPLRTYSPRDRSRSSTARRQRRAT